MPDRIPVYLMPGMAASPDIFEHLSLPPDQFEVVRLEWFLPEPGMSLESYARKMAQKVTHKAPVLVGVSFGGYLVQEMAEMVGARKVIIISSIKHKGEMPRRLLVARHTRLHKLLPTSLVTNVEVLARYAFGDTVIKRLELYERYLSIRDKRYLDWALDTIVHWERSQPVPGLVHIHGDADAVFPIGHIGPCIRVAGGTHTMIIHRFRWFNEHLPAIILQDRGSI
ncbi:alpha/beta fold hydrolase [Robiginitalea sediminis]|uniref:alpha/beta fold hydrolase n=1 Tax=Robiginitalea sediminis TaxID=1982593 RepID=UPI000B4A6E88|nr:alpha/beta fold hydrolase [Robiginitalea sediminis]